jgi:hypothetical protein
MNVAKGCRWTKKALDRENRARTLKIDSVKLVVDPINEGVPELVFRLSVKANEGEVKKKGKNKKKVKA